MYKHKIQYYETDKMGITHHSNYIRFMEEARVEWMDNLGISYKKCEEMGIASPVLSSNCIYKRNTTFGDIINIEVKLKEYNGIRIIIQYKMTKGEQIVAIGETQHCFLNTVGVPIKIKKEYPEIDGILREELKNC